MLVDAGISCRETERRMARLGLSMSLVKAVFISHEHSDHIKGLRVLSKKYRLPVYITGPTHERSGVFLEQDLIRSFCPGEEIRIGDLTVKAFRKEHDCSDPHSFLVSGGGVTVGVLTDIGQVCQQVIGHFKQCHAAFLEANYDEAMLNEGHYPWHLKQRIRSGKGHLSNTQALELFRQHRPGFMSRLLLSHLSSENNSPQLVQRLFEAHAGQVSVSVASRDWESALYHIPSVDSLVAAPLPGQVVQGLLF